MKLRITEEKNVTTKNILLLLAYAIISNEYIHVEQLKFLNRLIGKDEGLHKAAYNILLSDNTHNKRRDIEDFKEQLFHESDKDRKRFRKNMVRLMCYDGEYDEIERAFVDEVFPGYEPQKAFVRRHIFLFHYRIRGTFISRIFKLLSAKLFHNGLPYFRNSKKEAEELFSSTDNVAFKAFNLALDTANQCQKWNIYAKLYEMKKEYIEKVEALNNTEPTIALVGKTKAGKSTCFSLLCGMGDDFIGKGGQRTTKTLTAAHYHGIKVIDTPGLGAAAIAGEEDESKTKLACKMVDAVLFVMGNDTYDDEINFMDRLVEDGKPITVLINYKNNDVFEFQERWAEFKEKPDFWKADVGEDRMAGWENSLMKRAKKKGLDHMLEGRIYKSFLLAARYSLKRGKNISHKRISASRKEWKNIYYASNYGQTMDAFFADFMENFNCYRLSQHMILGKDALGKLSSCAQELRDRAKKLRIECEQKLENLKAIEDEFAASCKSAFQEFLRGLQIEETMQFENEIDHKLYKSGNKSFEEYVVALYNRVSKEVCERSKK